MSEERAADAVQMKRTDYDPPVFFHNRLLTVSHTVERRFQAPNSAIPNTHRQVKICNPGLVYLVGILKKNYRSLYNDCELSFTKQLVKERDATEQKKVGG